MVEETIATIINQYGTELWLGFVTLVITGFVLSLIRGFISDLVDYFRARMSDVGYGQRIYWRGEIFIVDRIKFQHIVAHDDKKRILIPIGLYLGGVKEYPNHRHDDFDENRYHERPWDGVNDRRKNNRKEE